MFAENGAITNQPMLDAKGVFASQAVAFLGTEFSRKIGGNRLSRNHGREKPCMLLSLLLKTLEKLGVLW